MNMSNNGGSLARSRWVVVKNSKIALVYLFCLTKDMFSNNNSFK